MSWRVVVIESQSKLDYKMGYLVVRGLETKRVLLDEIAVLLIENPAVFYDRCLDCGVDGTENKSNLL